MTSNTAAPPAESAYFLDRDWQSSARLSLQHYICTRRLGYLVHPTISKTLAPQDAPQILDLATGNGIWAIEAHNQYPNAIFTCLDLAGNQFPPFGSVPETMKFELYNFFDPVPDKFKEKFDIIHISFILGALFRGGRDTVIKHVFEMLKPGGWLQWQEAVNPPIAMVNRKTGAITGDTPSARVAEKHFKFVSQQDWTVEMAEILSMVGGFLETTFEEPDLDMAYLNVETPLMQWIAQEVLTTMASAIKTEEVQKDVDEALKQTHDQVKEGTLLHYKFGVGIGKKPL